MEKGTVQEFKSNCLTCHWHGRKYGSNSAAQSELIHHISSPSYQGHEGEITVTEINYAEYPELSKEAVKLLFIRKSAGEAFSTGELKEATKGILIEVVEVATASSMTNEDLGELLRDLEKSRSYLAAFTQGLRQAVSDKLAPEFKAKHEKEARAKRVAKSVGSNDLSASMQALGLSMESIMGEVANQLALEVPVQAKVVAEVAETLVAETISSDEVICEKCQKVTSKMFLSLHKC